MDNLTCDACIIGHQQLYMAMHCSLSLPLPSQQLLFSAGNLTKNPPTRPKRAHMICHGLHGSISSHIPFFLPIQSRRYSLMDDRTEDRMWERGKNKLKGWVMFPFPYSRDVVGSPTANKRWRGKTRGQRSGCPVAPQSLPSNPHHSAL